MGTAIEELTLNDGSVAVIKETSAALGPGVRCGFLVMLHMDVFMERLSQEHGEEVLSCCFARNEYQPNRLHVALDKMPSCAGVDDDADGAVPAAVR